MYDLRVKELINLGVPKYLALRLADKATKVGVKEAKEINKGCVSSGFTEPTVQSYSDFLVR